MSDALELDAALLDPPRPAVVDAVARALAEDLLPLGDLTAALVPPSVQATVAIVTRSAGVVAGHACVAEAIAQVDPSIAIDWRCPDGTAVESNSVVAVLDGSLRSILTVERTALNFLGHLSGIATFTRRMVEAVAAVDPRVRILDTRKTTPGLRSLEKAAVRSGGGRNHRGSLSEAVLVKDNHLGGLTIGDAVAQARRFWPGRMVEVECDRAEQVDQAVEAGATVVMLDNMTPEQAAACVAKVRALSDSILVEVSGGIDLETAPRYASAGVDLLSVGALTHSAPVLDLGFDLVPAVESRPSPGIPVSKEGSPCCWQST